MYTMLPISNLLMVAQQQLSWLLILHEYTVPSRCSIAGSVLSISISLACEKMDRASILGDTIKYLKELLQKINDLELESSPSTTTSLPSTPTSFHPLTPTLPTLPSRVKEELCSSALPSLTFQQPRVRDKTYCLRKFRKDQQ